MGQNININDGPASNELIKRTELLFDKDGWISELSFDGEEIYIRTGNREISFEGIETYDRTEKLGFGESNWSRNKVNEYFKLLERVKLEHETEQERYAGKYEGSLENLPLEKTDLETSTESLPLTSTELREGVVPETIKRANEVIIQTTNELRDESVTLLLTEEGLREFTKILEPIGINNEIIEALEHNADLYRLKALREVDSELRERFYMDLSKTSKLRADTMRLKMGFWPEHNETIEILNEEMDRKDLNRLEKFKRRAKENLVGLSAVAISIAGIITTIAIGSRRTIVKGTQVTSKFSKELAKLAKKVGPLFGTLLNMLSKAASLAAKGAAWLSGNLWVLVVVFVLFVVNQRRRRK